MGLEWQKTVIDRWCKERGAVLLGDFVDDGISASVPLVKRPQGRNLCLWPNGKDCVIVCAKVDRVFRSIEDMSDTLRAWRERGIKFVSASEGFDLDTIFGKFMLASLCALAEFERGLTRERITQGFETRKARGQRVSGHAPYGFRYEGGTVDKNGKRRGEKLVRDEREFEIMKTVRKWRKAGHSLYAIAKKCNDAGYPTRRGGKWIHTTVDNILKSYEQRKMRFAGDDTTQSDDPSANNGDFSLFPES